MPGGSTTPGNPPETIEHAAQALKRGAASLGLTALSERCRRIEACCRAGEPAGAADLQGDLDELVAQSQHAVETYLDEAGAQSSA